MEAPKALRINAFAIKSSDMLWTSRVNTPRALRSVPWIYPKKETAFRTYDSGPLAAF